jgi:hypothetical protein
LLADGGLLRTADGRFTVLARVHEEGEPLGTFLEVGAYLRGFGHFHLLLDTDGGLYATALAEQEVEATGRLRRRLREENKIELTGDGRHLEAERQDATRRPTVLHSGDGRVSLRARAYVDDDDEESLLRLRLFVKEFGAIQVVISEWGRVLALITGRTDSDAYTRIRGELVRKGIELED